jgi:type II secretory pathway predicted ATPase ExeA
MTENSQSLGRIVIVGPCASGKSTVARALRMHGYDAHVTSQEHSAVPKLWSRSDPSVLIALQADIESIRLRRQNPRWSQSIWQEQQTRLADAFKHADLVEDTSDLSANEVVDTVLNFLKARVQQTESD